MKIWDTFVRDRSSFAGVGSSANPQLHAVTLKNIGKSALGKDRYFEMKSLGEQLIAVDLPSFQPRDGENVDHSELYLQLSIARCIVPL